ncbi:hypothetical protein PG994_005315 [Apiospora phragmitis]|uniref:Asparaginase n=1 Tax=Apiospora phragmitis TaxID=2905665 RepID=A0ABR1VBW3_9PEZI
MNYNTQQSSPKAVPRLIIHGGASNIQPENFSPEKVLRVPPSPVEYSYMHTPVATKGGGQRDRTALEIAVHAVALLEDNPLFNSGHGAVFTRDGTNKLEASVMVSRGWQSVGRVGMNTCERWSAKNLAYHSATWSPDEYLPQGTVCAVALDSDGVLCCATSTGGMTNKLTGRIGDTPSVGAGFWGEEWSEQFDSRSLTARTAGMLSDYAPHWWRHFTWPARAIDRGISLLGGLFSDCLSGQLEYSPLAVYQREQVRTEKTSRRCGICAVVSMARWAAIPATKALHRVAGRRGELQKSAADRWGKTGEGEGGMIGIESIRVEAEDGHGGMVSSKILQDFNCGGMFRAWIDEDGNHMMKIWDHVSDEQDLMHKHAGLPCSKKGQERRG